MFGICNLAIIPLRSEPNHRSELVSQVLFGEHFQIIEENPEWSKIQLAFDDYTGWIDNKQYQSISENEHFQLQEDSLVLNSDLIEYITN